MWGSVPTARDVAPSLELLPVLAAQHFRGLIMVMAFRNNVDNRCYAAAEDAFTSEGGYLAHEADVPEKDVDADRKALYLSSDFSTMVGRYAEGMRAVLTVFRSGRRRAARLRKCGNVQTPSVVPPNVMGATSSIASSREEPS